MNSNTFAYILEASTHSSVNALSITTLKDLVAKHALVVLRGFQDLKTNEDFIQFSEKFGEVTNWPFGKILELQKKDSPDDHIFDSSFMPMHWDGMYRDTIPHYQIFRCLTEPAQDEGGETTFSHTTLALKRVDSETKKDWRKIIGVYERNVSFYHSKVSSPLVTKHPFLDFEVIRFQEPCDHLGEDFINPPIVRVDSHIAEQVKDVLYHPDNFYAHEWHKGDIVLSDNLVLLHGRKPFMKNSKRHLQRIQVEASTPVLNLLKENLR